MKKLFRIIFPLCMVMALLFLIAGCSDTSAAPIVVPKESEHVGEAKTISVESGLTIQDQVQIPERFQADMRDNTGLVSVLADAEIIIPDVQGFKLKKVTGRPFEQEDVDRTTEVLLQGNPLYKVVGEETADGNEDEKAETEKVEPVIEYDEAMAEKQLYGDLHGEGISEWSNILDGNVRIDGAVYQYWMDNNWSSSQKDVICHFHKMDNSDYQITSFSDVDESGQPYPVSKKIRKQAKALVKEMGFEEMVLSGEKASFFSYIDTEMITDKTANEEVELSGVSENSKMEKVYYFYFTREVEGIPITYASQQGSSLNEDGVYWPEEFLRLGYNEQGLKEFVWHNPYVVKEYIDDYVFLLPFSEIEQIFKSTIMTKYAGMGEGIAKQILETELYKEGAYAGTIYPQELEIHEVRLGYMRILEPGNLDEGTLVPVWDFYGTHKASYGYNTENVGGEGDTNYSILTINAMDGTIIDRDHVGY